MAHDHDAHAKGETSRPVEHRFVPEPTSRSNLQALIGGLGAAALGAAAYGTWLKDVQMPVAPYLFAAGALAMVVAAVVGETDTNPVRVGDVGVAVEHGSNQPDRIPWYEVRKIALDEKDHVIVETRKRKLLVSTRTHPTAAAWIIKEGMDRIPKRVEIDAGRVAPLLRGADEPGQIVKAEPPQVAGQHCRASKAIIAFEKDARTCKRCGEIYDRRHVPPTCLTCEAPM